MMMMMIVSSQKITSCCFLLLLFVVIICNCNNNNVIIVLAADTATTTRTTTTKSNPIGQQQLLTRPPPSLLLLLHLRPETTTTKLLQWKQKQRKQQQQQRMITTTTTETTTINILRGGSNNNNNNNNNNNYFIEENPNYIHYTTTNTPSNNEHEEWLNQQQQQQGYVTTTYNNNNNNNYYTASTSTTGRRFGLSSSSNNNSSLLGIITNYFINLHLYNPTLFYTTISCVVVFILWRIPQLSYSNPIFTNLFVCSYDTVIKSKGLSLLFASISHISIKHLLMNLITLLHIGPNVQKSILTNKNNEQQIWKLMLGSSITSNGFFVLLSSTLGKRRRSGNPAPAPAKACLGLSGVTMSLIAILASIYPNRIFGIRMYGIFPIRLQAKYILQGLIVISIIGSLIPSTSGGGIAHLTHLGGLLYGILYYQLILCNKRPYHHLFQETKRNLLKSIVMK